MITDINEANELLTLYTCKILELEVELEEKVGKIAKYVGEDCSIPINIDVWNDSTRKDLIKVFCKGLAAEIEKRFK